MTGKDSGHILDIPRAARNKLVDDQILGRGESDRHTVEDDPHRTADGLCFIGGGGEDQTNTNAAARIGQREYIGPSHKCLNICHRWREVDSLHRCTKPVQLRGVNAKSDIDIASEPGFAVEMNGLSPDQHIGDTLSIQGPS